MNPCNPARSTFVPSATGKTIPFSSTIWIALAHDDVTALLRQPKLSSHESRLSQDPAGHARLRGLVAGAFTPRRIEALRATAQAVAGELIDGLLVRAASGLSLIHI